MNLLADAGSPAPTGFVLRALQVFNWGPFGGLHQATFDAWGSAIIGATGSGKTTLVDALMTLLVDKPRYNLASTGGTESDRDLMSYLRGDSGVGNDSDNRHVARPDKTVSGIAATFVHGERQVQLAAVFWLGGPSRAAADRKDAWLFTQADAADELPGLPHWLGLLAEEGARGLKHQARLAEGVQVFDAKRAYLAQVQRCFAVSDNAFRLLNRATGLKQLSSIDEIFRELVLDDRSAFDRATQVAQEFDQLVGIRAELERARDQVQSLRPIAALAPRRAQVLAGMEDGQALLRLLPWWFAQAAQARWQAESLALQAEMGALQQQQRGLQEQIEQQTEAVAARQLAYAEAGGSDVQTLLALLRAQQGELAQAERHAAQYQPLARRMGWSDKLSADHLAVNHEKALQSLSELREKLQNAEQLTYDTGARHSADAQRKRELDEEIERIRERPGSNVPSLYQDWRAQLAAVLGLPPEDLPFVAELTEVPAAERRWRGAIERALGGERLRLLVPPTAFAQALGWVNGRHNRGVLVRLLDVQAAWRERRADPLADGYVAKLTLKNHALTPALRAVLAQRDRHCVESAEALARTPRAMTVQGSFSDTAGRYEKDDRRDLGEGWLTGFDNRDQLNELQRRLDAAEAARQASLAARDQAQALHRDLGDQLELLQGLAELRFEQLDVPGRAQAVGDTQARIDARQRPGSDLALARRALETAQQQLHLLREQEKDRAVDIGKRQDRLERADAACRQAGERAQQHAPGAHVLARLQPQLPDLAAVSATQLQLRERDEHDALHRTLQQADVQRHELEKKLVSAMHGAQRVDTGELAQAGTDMPDIDAYLARLHVLETEGLPAKRERFQSYLNTSSDQGVSQLLQAIDDEVQEIEARILAINATLRQVAFQPGRYLQLVCQRVQSHSVKELLAAQQRVRLAALKAEADEGEGHFQALQEVVRQLRLAAASARTLGARALLDPRWRIQFAIAVVDAASGQVLERRTGSQGGSGGEKEVIAIYVLTASLSYTLCSRQEGGFDAVLPRPRFATIVLDEAFSRTSQAVAARIVAALRAFGLYPLFVTPNKELRLLREHTRRAVLVQRQGAQARLASIGWAEIDAQAAQRAGVAPAP